MRLVDCPIRIRLLAAVAALVAAVAAPAADAASLWAPRDVRGLISLEMLRPSIEGLDAEVFSSAFYLSGRLAATPTVTFVAELPYARMRGSAPGYSYYPFAPDEYYPYPYSLPASGSTIGNPYVGFEAAIPGSPLFVEFGGRPPLASDREYDAEVMGAVADLTRFFAFTEQYASVQFGVNVYEVLPSKLACRIRVSPLLAIPSESYLETEFFTFYSVQAGYQGRSARAGMGLAGMALLTENYPSNLGQRTVTQLELHADFLSGRVRPGVDVHLPLGTLASSVPVVVGTGITWAP